MIFKKLIFNAFHSSYFLFYTLFQFFPVQTKIYSLLSTLKFAQTISGRNESLFNHSSFSTNPQKRKKKAPAQIKLPRCKTKSALSPLVICSNSFQKKIFRIISTVLTKSLNTNFAILLARFWFKKRINGFSIFRFTISKEVTSKDELFLIIIILMI